jgi:hypothetical protein
MKKKEEERRAIKLNKKVFILLVGQLYIFLMLKLNIYIYLKMKKKMK